MQLFLCTLGLPFSFYSEIRWCFYFMDWKEQLMVLVETMQGNWYTFSVVPAMFEMGSIIDQGRGHQKK